MSFEARDYPISNIFNKAVFEIPRNQRRYVWSKENWQDLYDDLCFSISQDNPHFFGSIVLKEEQKQEGLDYYLIIDGQQRLTTITLLLISLMKLFLENNMDDDFLGTISYLQSKDNRNREHEILHSEYHQSLRKFIKAITQKESKSVPINAFIDTNTISREKDKNIGNAIKFFYETIRNDIEQCEDIQTRLRNIRDVLLDMVVVKITSSSDEDSYTIFEILNARGQELSSNELLKNYIMRYIQPTERRDDAKVQWEDMERTLGTFMEKFIKHYATHRFGDTSEKFANSYQAIQKLTRGENIGDLFDDLKLKSEYYSKIVNPSYGTEGNCSKIEYSIFKFFKKKRFELFRPILLSLIHQNELQNISKEKYELMLKYIYTFFVCYTIIGEEKSNKLMDVVYKYAKPIEEDCTKRLLNEFAKSLKDKIPSLEWFLNSFKNVGWSNHYDLYKGKKNKNRVQIVIEVLEKYISQKDFIDEFTLEHVLPDSEGIENSQIGNFIPLEERYNQLCDSEELNKKMEFYSQSEFSSARGFVSRYKDKTFDPSDRTKYLGRLMYNNILQLNQFDFDKD